MRVILHGVAAVCVCVCNMDALHQYCAEALLYPSAGIIVTKKPQENANDYCGLVQSIALFYA